MPTIREVEEAIVKATGQTVKVISIAQSTSGTIVYNWTAYPQIPEAHTDRPLNFHAPQDDPGCIKVQKTKNQ